MRTIEKHSLDSQIEQLLTNLENDGPITIQSNGIDVAVILPPGLLTFLLEDAPANVNPRMAALFKKSLVKRWRVYKALQEMELKFAEPDSHPPAG